MSELFEEGRRLASRREDLIAQGVDPAELEVPIAPHPAPFNTLHIWRQHGDHSYCTKCGRRWESTEGQPIDPCPGKRMPFGRRKGAK